MAPERARGGSLLPGGAPTPVLDIGSGVGALLVLLDHHPGREEIWARDEEGRRVAHTGVHSRGDNWYVVFVELPAGTYFVETGESSLDRVNVPSGAVAEVAASIGKL